MPTRHPVAVIGGGVAGCAAAAGLASLGVPVIMYEATSHVGGVAALGEHRTLCGLAALDTDEPELLEPALVAPWIPLLTTGVAYRHGRVWLWPTNAQQLMQGLRQKLFDLQVPVFYRAQVTALQLAADTITSLTTVAGKQQAVSGIIDASGSGVSAHLLGRSITSAEQWPAHRSRLSLPAVGHGKAERIRALKIAQQVIHQQAAMALTPLDNEEWQLSLDIAPGTSLADAAERAHIIATALSGTVIAQAIAIAERDEGRPQAQIELAHLFSTTERGVCWAAWPQEQHTPQGTVWSWPPAHRHGIPEAAIQLINGPSNLWFIGKGMPVDAAAASALRVTGTCLALGGAVAERVANTIN